MLLTHLYLRQRFDPSGSSLGLKRSAGIEALSVIKVRREPVSVRASFFSFMCFSPQHLTKLDVRMLLSLSRLIPSLGSHFPCWWLPAACWGLSLTIGLVLNQFNMAKAAWVTAAGRQSFSVKGTLFIQSVLSPRWSGRKITSSPRPGFRCGICCAQHYVKRHGWWF